MKKRIGLFGGSFDPVHMGHLHLALSLFEIHGLKEVWFIPAQVNPFKQNDLPRPFEDRAAMLSLALQDLPMFRVEEIERDLPAPSYTIDTVRALLKEHPQEHFALLLGEDAVASLPQWKNVHELLDLVPLLVGSRVQKLSPVFPADPPILRAIQAGWTPLPCLEISATELRKRFHLGLYCRHLVPGRVVDYIYKNGLY